MPGLHILSGDVQSNLDIFYAAQKKMLHFQDYNKKGIFKSENLFVGFTGYSTYPLEVIQKDNLFIVIEGYIYNKGQDSIISVCTEALNYARCSGRNLSPFKSKLEDFDGEFLIFCAHKKDGTFALFNDILGRLPFYYLFDNNELLMSRELKFFEYMKDRVEIDKLSVAHQLLFSNFLGNRTYFTNVKRLMPGSMILSNGDSGRLKVEEYYQWNFDPREDGKTTARNEADQLTELFLKSCENRLKKVDDNKLVLALSDGFDSRTVLAALNNFTSDIDTITYIGWLGEREGRSCSEIARSVADFHNNRWESFSLAQTNIGEMENMVRLYDATIPSVGPWHSLLPYVKREYGKETLFFTGDDGNLTLAPLLPSIEDRNVKDIKELVNIIFAHFGNQLFSLQDVQDLLNIEPDAIIDSVESLLSEYPEKTLVGKYIHSRIITRGFNWNFTREDAYRYYFWYTSLFWSPLFAKAAISVCSKHKLYSELYIKVMERIDACMNVPANKYVFKKHIWKEKIKLEKIRSSLGRIEILRRLYDLTKKNRGQEFRPFEPQITRDINIYDDNAFKAPCIFDQERLNKLMNNSITKEQFERLFTVSKYCQGKKWDRRPYKLGEKR